ncbi:MAG: sugar phosphate nucleotidyltransferase, partial [Candidatus Firestonebacteria bacterium]
VVIMAGGEGTRLSPFTKILPKPLIPIGEKPIMEIIVDRFMAYGCRDFYVSVNYKASILKAYFSDFTQNCIIKFVQEEKPLGTIGSLCLFKEVLKTTFFVTNCDILIEADYADILKFHKSNKNLITMVVSMKHYTIPYGVCEIKNGGDLRGILEKPEYDFLVNTGMYLMEPQVVKDIPQNSYYNMNELINDYVHHNKKIGAYPISEKSWLDMGEFQELQKTLRKFEARE